MSDKLKDILNKLQQHQQAPPEDLYNKIINGMSADEDDLTRLKKHQLDPPQGHYEKIAAALFITEKKKDNVIRMIFTGRRIAAVLILALAAWLVFYITNQKNNTGTYNAQNDTLLIPSKPNEQLADVEKKPTTTTPSIEATAITAIKNNKPAQTINKGIFKDLRIDGIPVKVVDNDLLYSLFNCDYKIIAPYLESEDKKMVIGLDQYSAVTVSPKMVSFMKTMYTTNRRNKPTRKAKKAVKALDKWKQKDVKYFDKNLNANPLDIIDLSEFIFDKKK